MLQRLKRWYAGRRERRRPDPVDATPQTQATATADATEAADVQKDVAVLRIRITGNLNGVSRKGG